MTSPPGRTPTLNPEQQEAFKRLLHRIKDEYFEGRQDFLAAHFEITPATISRYFSGLQSPSPELLARVTRFAGLDTDDVLMPDPSGNQEFGAAARFARRAGYREAAIERIRGQLEQHPTAKPAQFLRMIEAADAALDPPLDGEDDDD